MEQQGHQCTHTHSNENIYTSLCGMGVIKYENICFPFVFHRLE